MCVFLRVGVRAMLVCVVPVCMPVCGCVRACVRARLCVCLRGCLCMFRVCGLWCVCVVCCVFACGVFGVSFCMSVILSFAFLSESLRISLVIGLRVFPGLRV